MTVRIVPTSPPAGHTLQRPKIGHVRERSSVKKGSRITVKWPVCACSQLDQVRARFLQMAEDFGWLNVLEPLAAFAEKFNVAVLAITHPPKATQAKALHAITGSLAFVAAARLVFIAVEEPETSSGRRLLLAVKNNLGPPAAGLGFHLVQRIVSKDIVASHITWDSTPVTTTADQALAAASTGTTAQALDEAEDFLRDELAAGPRGVREIKASALGAGIAWRTVRRAQQKLGIKTHKAGLKEGWKWILPKESGPQNDDDELRR